MPAMTGMNLFSRERRKTDMIDTKPTAARMPCREGAANG